MKQNPKKNPFSLLLAPIDLAADQTAGAILAVKRGLAAVGNEIGDGVSAVLERDPAARSRIEVLLLSNGLHAILAHRLAHRLHTKGHTFLARAVSSSARFYTGIEIHPGATIGRGLVIDHGTGTVIGETAEIGDGCTIYQGVTLGGTGKDVGKRHPTLGNHIMVGAGAKVLGPVRIGDHAKIASGAVVLTEIPAGSTAVGIPARVVRKYGEKLETEKEERKGIDFDRDQSVGAESEAPEILDPLCPSALADELDQIHIPDPYAQEIARLELRISALEAAKKE